jgi:hypothetical protein
MEVGSDIEHIYQYLRGEIPNVVSYERFVILMPPSLEH